MNFALSDMSVKGALATKCTGTHLSALSPRSSGTNSLRGAQAQVFSGATGVYSRQKADRSHRRSTSFVPTYMLSLRHCTATEAVRAREVGMCLQTVNATLLKWSKSKDNLLRVTCQAGTKKRAGGWVIFSPQVCGERMSHL